ncbi:AhpC/TSA family protein [Echinicola strongylocentroti]|uniref:thioredoxin-dependent peroxiredoxin n=1 Tax=Echinicola strongylocentroti TaxID=1795355 RepID=A0A2Z4IJ12_9BACT|nr:peroxiredoxin-like family protein [Echinicola strongylocentroti]AWW30680.1 AhpC/TSA family protein [Echinicola strongylocentroti]
MRLKNIVLGMVAGLVTMVVFSTKAQEVPSQPTDISPLLIGEEIPESDLKDPDGNTVSLKKKIAQKPTVLIFYRGGWCPYCNKHLAELQEVEQEILDKGYQILAISPDAPEQLKATVDKNELTYSLYSDNDLKVTKSFGLAFQAPDRYKDMLFKASDQQNPGVLPVPSVFVLDKKGTILFEYVNPNYDSRMSGKMLTAVLTSLEE